MKWLVDEKHDEPDNEELGIKACRGCFGLILAGSALVEIGLLIWWLM